MKNRSVSTKLTLLALSGLGVALVIGLIGITTLRTTHQATETIYRDRVIPLQQLKSISDDYAVFIIDAVNKANAGLFSAEDALKGVREAGQRITAKWKEYRSTFLTPEEQKLATETEALLKSADVRVSALESFLAQQRGIVKGLLADFDGPLYSVIDPLTSKVTELVDLQLRVAGDEFRTSETAFTRSLQIMSVVLVAAIAGLIAMATWITRSITVPLQETNRLLKNIAEGEGDLTQRLTLSTRDEIGLLAGSFNAFVARIHGMVGDVAKHTAVLAASATEFAAVSADMGTGVTKTASRAGHVATNAKQLNSNAASVAASMEQASANLTNVASATEEMTATVTEIASNTEKARAISQQATAQTERASASIQTLGEAAQVIGAVTETITAISTQTNLLALNATIEAARAGAAGKGFAVVANEIKELARQTSAATEDIKGKVLGIQQSTGSAVTEISAINGVVRQVSEIVNTIAAAIEEQSAVTKDIASNISQASAGVQHANQRVAETTSATTAITADIGGINDDTRHMSSGTAQLLSSSKGLSKLSEELQTMVSRFKV